MIQSTGGVVLRTCWPAGEGLNCGSIGGAAGAELLAAFRPNTICGADWVTHGPSAIYTSRGCPSSCLPAKEGNKKGRLRAIKSPWMNTQPALVAIMSSVLSSALRSFGQLLLYQAPVHKRLTPPSQPACAHGQQLGAVLPRHPPGCALLHI